MKLGLLFAILAFTTQAKAQNLVPSSFNNDQVSNSIENVRLKMKEGGWKTFQNNNEMNPGKILNHQIRDQRSLIQLYDSIYQWQWYSDTIIMDWKYFLNEINIVYDADNNLTSLTLQFWNDTTWLTIAKIDYTYDANNNQTRILYQGWIGGTWENLEQEIYTYDANDNQIHYLDQNWNVNDWKNRVQSFFTYDGNNNQTKEIYQGWNGSTWENSEQYLYVYNIHNNQTREVGQSWNGFVWENSYQYMYTYDTDNNQTSYTGQTWHITGWENSFQSLNTYDVNNNLTGVIYNSWNGSAWVISNQYNYIIMIDANHNVTNELVQVWKDSIWVNSWEKINTYVDNFLESTSTKYFDTYGGTGTVTQGDSTYFYFHTVTGTRDLKGEDGSTSIYPNPTSGKFTISCNSTLKEIEIYNILGERIYAEDSNQHTSNEIDLSGYGKGIYFVKYYEGSKVYSRKIIVQ